MRVHVFLLMWLNTVAYLCGGLPRLPKDCRPEHDIPGDTGVICRDCERHGRSEFDLQTLPNTTTRLTVLDCPLITLIARQFVNFTGLTYLHLEDVDLTKIEVGAFDLIEFIDTVHIRKNDGLNHLQKDVFRGLDNITSLDISENNIETIDVNVFKTMQNLKNLTISSNNLNLETFSPELLKGLNLTYIDISDNPFDQIPNEALGELVSLQILIFHQAETVKNLSIGEKFLNLTQLHTFNVTKLGSPHVLYSEFFVHLKNSPVRFMDLHKNEIVHVEKDTFQYLRALRYLNMNYNPLTVDAVRNIFLGLRVPYLHVFSITDNREELFIDKTIFDGLRSNNITVGDFVAVNAQIKHVESFAFNGTRITGTLSFQLNNIKVLEPYTFYGLETLKGLVLMSNQITRMNLAFSFLKQLKYLDLSENRIHYNISYSSSPDMPNLEKLNLAMNAIDSIPSHSFKGMPQLIYLTLYGNSLRNIQKDAFTGLENLRNLILSSSRIAKISSDVLGHLPKLQYLSFEECTYLQEIGKNTLKGIPNVEDLSFQNCVNLNIEEKIFKGLPHLKTLRLDYVTRIKPEVITANDSFEGTLLQKLYVTKTNISKFPLGLYGKNMTHIDIENNNIYHIYPHIVFKYLMTYHDLVYFFGQTNPYVCTCALTDYVTWLNVSYYKHDVETGRTEKYKCIAPKPLKDYSILSLMKSKYKCLQEVVPVPLVQLYTPFIFEVCVLILMAICNTVIRFRLSLNRFVRKIIFQRHSLYDAYVFYCHEDYPFVLNELVMKLENHSFFKLAIRGRDIPQTTGSTNSRTITKFIQKSRKIILILSDRLLRSPQFCMLEVSLALELINDISKIIIIQIGSITEAVPPWLDEVVRDRGKLVWSNEESQKRRFWNSLKRELQKPKTSNQMNVVLQED